MAWRAFKSIQTGISLLILIGLVCVFGTMFYAANSVLGDNAIPLARAKVFNSWWFAVLLAIFFIQFVISTWHVTKMSCTIWWKRDFSRSRSYIEHEGPGRGTAEVPGGAAEVESKLTDLFTRAHRRGDRFFAHRGLRQRMGPTIIHAGIVVILIAGLVRFALVQTGYIVSEGRFIGEEGQTTNTIFKPIHDDQALSAFNAETFSIPYDITVLDFDEVMHPNSNSPAYFSSLLQIRDKATNTVRVVKLDMNHSVTIGGFEFHQASYSPVPPFQGQRTDFDVRDARTGERIAVTDASPETRVQVGNEDLFLEVGGQSPGAPWRLFTSKAPHKPIAQGTLLETSSEREITFAIVAFYPEFAITREEGPHTLSNEPNDPAAEVEVFVDGIPTGRTLVFSDPAKQALVPPVEGDFVPILIDIHVDEQALEDLASTDWRDPASAFFEIGLLNPKNGQAAGKTRVAFGAESPPIRLSNSEQGRQPPPEGAEYAVYPLGPTTRYATVLSVVREPIVPYYVFGVFLIALGAIMTFSGRYQALYARWDEERNRLSFALVPRFGRAPDPADVRRLVEALGGEPRPTEDHEETSGESMVPAMSR